MLLFTPLLKFGAISRARSKRERRGGDDSAALISLPATIPVLRLPRESEATGRGSLPPTTARKDPLYL